MTYTCLLRATRWTDISVAATVPNVSRTATRPNGTRHRFTNRESLGLAPPLRAPEDAFGSVESSRGRLDGCGFCGEEFANWPYSDLYARSQHLEQIHRFGQCNHNKTIYRADHLRQHLRHSHASEKGPWLDVIQNASHRHCEVRQDRDGKDTKGRGD